METSPLNPSLPRVRLLQHWIREQRPLSIDVIGQDRLEGRLAWQDPEVAARVAQQSHTIDGRTVRFSAAY